MSEWRIAVRELSELGGNALAGKFGTENGRQYARQLGLMQSEGRGTAAAWSLTPLGWDYTTNRVKFVRTRPGGTIWVATWLRALPRPGLLQSISKDSENEPEH